MIWLVAGVIFCAWSRVAVAQTGMTFDEFKEKLTPYFANELIADIRQQLPLGTQYRVWGWDVGDYSGDGFPDVACAIRLASDKKRVMNVYLFVDIDGYLTNIGRFPYPFIDIPLEVGVLIKENTCYAIQKYEQAHWLMTGYRFEKGALLVLDSFSTLREQELVHESYRNFQSLYGYEKYTERRTNTEELHAEFLSIPSYPRSRYVYSGYAQDAVSNLVRFVPEGAYYWSGQSDAALRVRSAYDKEFLYFSIRVTDDKVITNEKEGDPSEKIEVWVDVHNGENRLVRKRKRGPVFRTVADSGLFSFSITPGNFSTVQPSVHISSTDEMDELQREQVDLVHALAAPADSGYTVKIRIPFRLLGFEGAPVESDSIVELGCSVVVHDIDNYFRPEETTLIATSHFESMNPASYGVLLLVPPHKVYGSATNIYVEPLAERLKSIGF